MGDVDSNTEPGRRGVSRGELARKIVHMAVGLVAFAVVFLGPALSALCALVAILHNAFLFPRYGGKKLWRKGEVARGSSQGIVLYPVAVLLLVLCFWNRLEVAAAIWGILAFGDGMASLVGMTIGRSKLPWNSGKSWAGTWAYFLFGTAAATILLIWTAPASGNSYSIPFALGAAAATTLVAALIESLDQGLDDNVRVPLPAGLFLYCWLLTQGRWDALASPELVQQIAIGAGVNLMLAGLAYAAKTVNASGVVAGFLVGTAIYGALGWQGFLILMTFFVLGSAMTKLGYSKKAERKLAQEDGGRRGAKHAIANGGVATIAAFFAATTAYPELFAVAFAAAFATASADTAGSEIGQLMGRRTFLITNLKPVPRGTEGAVSVEGTVAGILASLLVGALGAVVGLYPWIAVLPIVLAAFVGTTLESLIGATLEKRGLLDNEAVNFLNTLVGAVCGAAFAVWWL